MSDERYTVSAVLPDDQIVDGVFRLSQGGQDVGLSFELHDRKLNARANDYFEALADIRRELEKDNIFLNCYGASRNVYPSGMARDMGAGLQAYKLTIGKQATMEDLVFIFDTGSDVEPSSVLEQKDFSERWLKEGAGRKGGHSDYKIAIRKARGRRIEFIRQRLLRKGMPRILVSLILSLTALAGFLTSFSLLHLGVTSMWLRYPIAISVAYCVFLLLLALWLWLQRRSVDIDASALDPAALDLIPTEYTEPGESFHFGGGDAGGGGAGGSWGECASSASSEVSSKGSTFSAVGLDLDIEEGWLLVVAVIALIGGLIASFYLIYIAPVLLAELLVDGVLVAGLYSRVKGVEQRHWLRAALRQTFAPALLVTLFFTLAGYALQRAVPEARTIGEVWSHVRRVDR